MSETYPRFTHDRGRLVIQPCAGAPLQILEVVDGDYRWRVLPRPVLLAVALGTTDPRQPLTEWPGPGECPPGLWELQTRESEGRMGRFIVVPDESYPVWVCALYSMHRDEFSLGDRFVPVDD